MIRTTTNQAATYSERHATSKVTTHKVKPEQTLKGSKDFFFQNRHHAVCDCVAQVASRWLPLPSHCCSNPRNTITPNIPSNTIKYQATPSNTKQYHQISNDTMSSIIILYDVSTATVQYTASQIDFRSSKSVAAICRLPPNHKHFPFVQFRNGHMSLKCGRLTPFNMAAIVNIHIWAFMLQHNNSTLFLNGKVHSIGFCDLFILEVSYYFSHFTLFKYVTESQMGLEDTGWNG